MNNGIKKSSNKNLNKKEINGQNKNDDIRLYSDSKIQDLKNLNNFCALDQSNLNSENLCDANNSFSELNIVVDNNTKFDQSLNLNNLKEKNIKTNINSIPSSNKKGNEGTEFLTERKTIDEEITNRTKAINDAKKARKEFEKKITIMVNRLNKLKKIEADAVNKLNKIKEQVFSEQKTKLYKEEILKELDENKKNIFNDKKYIHDQISKKVMKIKEDTQTSKSKLRIYKKHKYSESKNNSSVILKLINQVQEHELLLKKHKVEKIKEDLMNKSILKEKNERIKSLERKKYYDSLILETLEENKAMKEQINILERMETETVEILNKTIAADQKELEKGIKEEVKKVLQTNSNLAHEFAYSNNNQYNLKKEIGIVGANKIGIMGPIPPKEKIVLLENEEYLKQKVYNTLNSCSKNTIVKNKANGLKKHDIKDENCINQLSSTNQKRIKNSTSPIKIDVIENNSFSQTLNGFLSKKNSTGSIPSMISLGTQFNQSNLSSSRGFNFSNLSTIKNSSVFKTKEKLYDKGFSYIRSKPKKTEVGKNVKKNSPNNNNKNKVDNNQVAVNTKNNRKNLNSSLLSLNSIDSINKLEKRNSIGSIKTIKSSIVNSRESLINKKDIKNQRKTVYQVKQIANNDKNSKRNSKIINSNVNQNYSFSNSLIKEAIHSKRNSINYQYSKNSNKIKSSNEISENKKLNNKEVIAAKNENAKAKKPKSNKKKNNVPTKIDFMNPLFVDKKSKMIDILYKESEKVKEKLLEINKQKLSSSQSSMKNGKTQNKITVRIDNENKQLDSNVNRLYSTKVSRKNSINGK